MAKGYWIANVDITDPEGYKAYVAANAALEYARSLPPGIARSQAFKKAGKLRTAADRLRAPEFAPRGRRPK